MVMEGVRMRGSLPDICEGRVGGGGRPESILSWWWDIEFGGECPPFFGAAARDEQSFAGLPLRRLF